MDSSKDSIRELTNDSPKGPANAKGRIQKLVTVLVFVVIGLLIHRALYGVFRAKTKEAYNYIGSFYELPRNKMDVLVLGSSHAYCGVQPNELWKDYGYSSYVLACPSQSISSSYYLLKEALAYQKPKVVLLEAYYTRYHDLYKKEGSLRHVTDGMRMGKAKLEMLRDMLKGRDWKDQASYYLPFLMYHSRWNDLKSYDFQTVKWLLGGNPEQTAKPQTPCKIPKKKKDLPENVLIYLDKIEKLCAENEIPLIFFKTPIAEDKRTTNQLRYFVALEDYAKERGIPFLFEQRDNLAGIDYERDFRNPTHLNLSGAVKMTHMLGDFLSSSYSLPDHRGDKAYRYWEQCYQSYEAYLASES